MKDVNSSRPVDGVKAVNALGGFNGINGVAFPEIAVKVKQQPIFRARRMRVVVIGAGASGIVREPQE